MTKDTVVEHKYLPGKGVVLGIDEQGVWVKWDNIPKPVSYNLDGTVGDGDIVFMTVV